ncbi:tyrosine--tRNA ligase, mitochondrial-like [Haliotis rubra]|uniref:tyrosine--tRNA ligase, mitochondrial-like n=1 Tax=Haliotis rubra TaxID=36100 RepID=UPI001EE56956|nr:tyrosine--tRNA ligase, mitochondrial-like [Haliotis rubra]
MAASMVNVHGRRIGCQFVRWHWQVCKRLYSSQNSRNILTLHERGIFQTVFPEGSTAELLRRLSSQQCMYCGFDPTADSLHVGNLLAIIALIHCQRAGHNTIALVGGATAQIGDPSGKTKERIPMKLHQVEENVVKITENLQRVFSHHQNLLWKNNKPLPEVRILNNLDWYRDMNIVDFLSTTGRHFRMGQMLSRHSVKSRLKSEDGMSFTEFTYQIFQSYDWLHLYKQHQCAIQIGGNDQLGNMTAGYELISRLTDNPVFGLTVPLITSSMGDKLGKTAGNAVWLCPTKTSPYLLYQYFLNLPDTDVEKYLKLLTFLPDQEIQDVLRKHKRNPEQRPGQRKIAEQVLLLVHGEQGLSEAVRWTDALFSGNIEGLARLTHTELLQLFNNADTTEMLLEPGMSVLDVCMKAGCFDRDVDAERIIQAGGVHINHRKVQQPDYVLIAGEHILPSNITLIRVGKKNYYVVKWVR